VSTYSSSASPFAISITFLSISAAEVNIGVLRELYPTLSLRCFIKKPVTIEYLAERLLAELD
jgi:hypothetical protein